MVPKPTCVPRKFHTVSVLSDEDLPPEFHTHRDSVALYSNRKTLEVITWELDQICSLIFHLLFPISDSVQFLFIQNME